MHLIHILAYASPIPTDIVLNDTAAEGTVRLVGRSTPLEGRVEVFLLGQWGTVCDNNWDLADATVVCHQLGYLRAIEAPRSAAFGSGSGPSWYYSVYCSGTECKLTECDKSNYNFGRACSHSQDAGVACSSECGCASVLCTCTMEIFCPNMCCRKYAVEMYSNCCQISEFLIFITMHASNVCQD